jgi:hypothetical protein
MFDFLMVFQRRNGGLFFVGSVFGGIRDPSVSEAVIAGIVLLLNYFLFGRE